MTSERSGNSLGHVSVTRLASFPSQVGLDTRQAFDGIASRLLAIRFLYGNFKIGMAHDGLQGGESKRPISDPNSLLPRALTL